MHCAIQPLLKAYGLVEVVLVYVEQDDERLRCEELEPAKALGLIGRELLVADGRLAFEMFLDSLEQVTLLFDGVPLGGLRALGILVEPLQPALQQFEIGEQELQQHVSDIAEGIDRAVDVEYGIVLERPRDDEQRVHPLEVVQVLAGYPARPAGRGCRWWDVDVAHRRGHGFPGCVQLREAVKPRVGHRCHPDVRFSAVRGHVDPPARQSVEHGGLPTPGKTYDADFHGYALRGEQA